jgi:hypothetical protein
MVNITGIDKLTVTHLILALGESIKIFGEHQPVEALLSHCHVHAENMLHLFYQFTSINAIELNYNSSFSCSPCPEDFFPHPSSIF